jgi:hypothetical protein
MNTAEEKLMTAMGANTEAPSEPKLAPTPENIGNKLARNMFKSRGNHFEIHLLEQDLALLIKGGCEIALDGVGTRNVEALIAQRDALTEANKKLREALAELLAAELSQMPPGDDGIEAQNAWADRRAAARNSAAMLLKVTP